EHRREVREAPEVVDDVETTRGADEPAAQRDDVPDVAPPRPLAFAAERLDAAVDLRAGRGPQRDVVAAACEPVADIPHHALEAAVLIWRRFDDRVHDEQDSHGSASPRSR